ncbi:MAG: DUF2249 domain-containing protein [Alphaproteobacteria bacterium]|nr:DUF2249 domain-containing protein [Alphaproteobacteria bacterium]
MSTYDFTERTKVAEALERRPELRTLLPAFHPAFNKLNHPVLGRVMPRLVTLGEAARVVGVDAAALVEVCNLPGAPRAALPTTERRMEPTPPWLEGAEPRELDLRPVIAGGEEPFPHIFAALRELDPGQPLRLRVGFEPAPLISLLGRRGWLSHVTWEGEDCLTSFWRPDPVDLSAPSADPGERLADGVLDLRGLEPPQPLRLALATIDRVLPLTLLHDRTPALLLPKLEARGLTWELEQLDDHVKLTVHAPEA